LLCLRLGVIKCHARGDINDDAIRLRAAPNGVVLSFAPGWAESHLRTCHLLNEEVAMWERSGPLKIDVRP